jgi:hypothetical protein
MKSPGETEAAGPRQAAGSSAVAVSSGQLSAGSNLHKARLGLMMFCFQCQKTCIAGCHSPPLLKSSSVKSEFDII